MNWILDLRKELGIPHTLKELIKDDSKFEEMSEMALNDPSTGMLILSSLIKMIFYNYTKILITEFYNSYT